MTAIDTQVEAPVKSTISLEKEEVNQALERIFDSAAQAIQQVKKENAKVTLEQVDATLRALFDAVNAVSDSGGAKNVPDFTKTLKNKAAI